MPFFLELFSNHAYSQLHASGGGPEVLAAIDLVDAHILPFFASQASIG